MKKFFIILPLITLLLSACSTETKISTARLSEVRTCAKLKEGLCRKEKKAFHRDTPEIFVSAKINNAPIDTKITFTWRYLEHGGQDIDSVWVVTKENENIAQSSLDAPTNGWPTGDYEVVLKLDSKNSKPIHKKFKIYAGSTGLAY